MPPLDSLDSNLATQLLAESTRDASITPMDALLDAARAGKFGDDQGFRFLARLWTFKRMMYYVYGFAEAQCWNSKADRYRTS